MFHGHHHHHVHSWNYCYVCDIKYCYCGEERRLYLGQSPWITPYIPWNPFPGTYISSANSVKATAGNIPSHSH